MLVEDEQWRGGPARVSGDRLSSARTDTSSYPAVKHLQLIQVHQKPGEHTSQIPSPASTLQHFPVQDQSSASMVLKTDPEEDPLGGAGIQIQEEKNICSDGDKSIHSS